MVLKQVEVPKILENFSDRANVLIVLFLYIKDLPKEFLIFGELGGLLKLPS